MIIGDTTNNANYIDDNRFTRLGKHTKSDIENGPVEIVDLPIKNGGSFHSLLFTRGYQLCSDFVVRITAAMMFIGWSRGERADFGIPSFEMRDEKL